MKKTEAVEKIPIKKKFLGIIKTTGIIMAYIKTIHILYLKDENSFPANENQEMIMSPPMTKYAIIEANKKIITIIEYVMLPHLPITFKTSSSNPLHSIFCVNLTSIMDAKYER